MRADRGGPGRRGERGMTGDDAPPRLADHAGLDAWMAAVLRSTGPYKVAPGRKQRVLLGLGHSSRRRTPAVVWPAVLVGVLFGCGALASAALGRWRGSHGLIERTYERLIPRRATAAGMVVAERQRWHSPTSAASPTIAPPAAPPLGLPATR